MSRRRSTSGQAATPSSHTASEQDVAVSYVWQTPARRPKKQPAASVASGGRGGGLTPADRARLDRIVSRAPEVMVKITGRTKGIEHLASHLAYITRNGELPTETEQGVVFTGRGGLRDLQERWTDDVALDRRCRADGTLSVNMILSMPPGTDSVKVRDAVRAFAFDAFEGRHDYAFALHQDDEHPHVHLTVRSLGYDGRRLNPRKADLHHWRERFAEELRLRGIAAEATPRRARGRVRKAERGPVRAMRDRGVQPRVDRLAREAFIRETTSGLPAERPWEDRSAARQRSIRARYTQAARELAASTDPADRELAQRIEAFVTQLPGPRLRRHELQEELARFADRVRTDRDVIDGRSGDVKPKGEGTDRER